MLYTIVPVGSKCLYTIVPVGSEYMYTVVPTGSEYLYTIVPVGSECLYTIVPIFTGYWSPNEIDQRCPLGLLTEVPHIRSSCTLG